MEFVSSLLCKKCECHALRSIYTSVFLRGTQFVSCYRQTLEDLLVIFRRKYVKPESQATAKHKWHRLVFNPNTMKLPEFLEELNQGAEKVFGESFWRARSEND